jgi:hypothetical protein
MADQVVGAVASLISRLYELLKEEYNLQTHLKKHIRTFSQEHERK